MLVLQDNPSLSVTDLHIGGKVDGEAGGNYTHTYTEQQTEAWNCIEERDTDRKAERLLREQTGLSNDHRPR